MNNIPDASHANICKIQSLWTLQEFLVLLSLRMRDVQCHTLKLSLMFHSCFARFATAFKYKMR